MKTIAIILFILSIAVGAISYQMGYRLDWEKVKKPIIIYLISCGGGLNIYIIYQLLTGV